MNIVNQESGVKISYGIGNGIGKGKGNGNGIRIGMKTLKNSKPMTGYKYPVTYPVNYPRILDTQHDKNKKVNLLNAVFVYDV